MSQPIINSVDARTGSVVEAVAASTSDQEVKRIAHAARDVTGKLQQVGRETRALWLRNIAIGLRTASDQIIATADRETALGSERLATELARTIHQCRFFADVIEDGAYLEATIDRPTDAPGGIGQDIRSMLVPIGPVAVFGSSNFPLAFSVPGGDTISALAAGNPVIVKAHSSHPATSLLAFQELRAAARSVNLPEEAVGIVFGQSAGIALVSDSDVKAVGFTGSPTAGRVLMDAIHARDDPIPFYGELSSVNPVIITREASRVRGSAIAAGLVDSVTTSHGQMCTKPGVILLPAGVEGDQVLAEMTSRVATMEGHTLLNDRIRRLYAEHGRYLATAGLQLVGEEHQFAGMSVGVRLWSVDSGDFNAEMAAECFGPSTVVVRYHDIVDVLRVLRDVPPSLTGTIHFEPGELRHISEVIGHFEKRAGRVVFNSYPTGVRVSWAQHHGGPWPSTNTNFTSVGANAIRRFLRPLAWQNAPVDVLPEELRDDYAGITRRVDGHLTQ